MGRTRKVIQRNTIMPLLWVVGLAVMVVLATKFKLLSLYEGIQVLLMYTLVLVTAQYAASTDRMAKEMQAESATRRPYLNLDDWHLPDSNNKNLWQVSLKNFGNVPAYAVQLEAKPRLSGYQEALPVQCTNAWAVIMPNQRYQWMIDLGSTLQIASKQHARLEIEFIIRYCNAPRKPFKAWETRLVRTPEPAISNWDLVGEDSEKEFIP